MGGFPNVLQVIYDLPNSHQEFLEGREWPLPAWVVTQFQAVNGLANKIKPQFSSPDGNPLLTPHPEKLRPGVSSPPSF